MESEGGMLLSRSMEEEGPGKERFVRICAGWEGKSGDDID
jgi:hypothetical protein